MACLSGPRDCTCTAGECPEPREACFPPGDCPAEVRQHAADASCLRLEPVDFGGGLPSEFLCLCGCPGCAAVCDGKGPVMGVAADGSTYASPAFLVDLSHVMPAQGRLGIYLRVRGLSNAGVVLARQAPDGSGDLEVLEAPIYYVLTPLDSQFAELVLYDDLLNDAYQWGRHEDRPVVIAIVPQSNAEQPIPALFEIDCLVPFVVDD